MLKKLSFKFIHTGSNKFIRVQGNTDCGAGSSNVLYDYGSGTTLEYCQQNCFRITGCSDITWSPSNGHCKTFDGCESAGNNNAWDHYVLTGTFKLDSSERAR